MERPVVMAGNPAWQAPHKGAGVQSGPGNDDWSDDKDTSNWRQPHAGDKKGRAFQDSRVQQEDDPSQSFTTRKRHGWWGKEERFDEDGNNMDGSGSRRRAWFFDEGK